MPRRDPDPLPPEVSEVERLRREHEQLREDLRRAPSTPAARGRHPQDVWRWQSHPPRADSQHVLASVLRTADQRGLDATDVLVALLTAPPPSAIPAVH